jgi:hypothetical protein
MRLDCILEISMPEQYCRQVHAERVAEMQIMDLTEAQ